MSTWIEYNPPYSGKEILDIILDIYKALSRLGHFEATDSNIIYAPVEGHTLDLSSLQPGTIIDDRVLWLMRHLPIPEPDDQTYITFGQRALDYRQPMVLASSRHIDQRHGLKVDYPLDTTNARPTDMILLDKYQGDDKTIVLDVVDHTIREFGNSPGRDQFMTSNASQAEKDAYASHYRNYPTHSAPVYLRTLLEKLLKADTIPNLVGHLVSTEGPTWPQDLEYDARVRELKRKLLEDYMWPGDDFREEDWKRDGRGLADAALYPDQ